MASISTLGIGSGLDLSSILDSLQSSEKASLTPISTQQSSYTAKLSAYSTLKSALSTFQTANTTLNSADLFASSTAQSSSSAFSATTSAGATVGKYTLSVTQLATAQTLTSAAQTSNTTALGSADSTITIQPAGAGAKAVTVAVSAANSSLSGIRDAINKANAGVTASIIKVGDNSYRLSMSANKSGTDNAVTVSVSGDSTLQGILNYDGTSNSAMTQSVAAQNAKLTVNNIAIENSSNTISDAMESVTLSLNDVTSGNQTLTISQDTSKASSAVSAWVDAYNALQDTFSSLTKYTAVDKGTGTQDTSNGPLLGDSTLRSIQTQLQGMLTNSSGATTLKTLAQVGVTSDPTSGKLTLDSSKLNSALSSSPDAVKALIVGDGKTTGLTTAIATNVTSWLSTKGIVQSATDGVSQTLKNLTQQYNSASQRIDDTIARYKTQFTALDVMINQLNSTSSYLTSQFDTSSDSKK